MTLVLYVLSGKDLGRVERFEQGQVLVGRAAEADLRLDHASISRQHARLVRKSASVVHLTDLRSTSGTFFEGERVSQVVLGDGDLFRLADVELRLRIETHSPSGLGEIAEGELELEGDWDVAPVPAIPVSKTSRAQPTAEPKARPSVERSPARPLSPLEEARRSHRKAESSPSGKPILQYSRTEREGGWASGDLAQRPSWQRVLVALLALGLFAALAYGSFQLTQGLRSARQAPADSSGLE